MVRFTVTVSFPSVRVSAQPFTAIVSLVSSGTNVKVPLVVR